MNIKFTDNKAGHNYTDAKVLTWKLYAKEFTKKVSIHYAIGGLFIVIGLITFNSSASEITINDVTKQHSFHFILTLGLVWIYLTGVRHFGLVKEKEKYMKKLVDNANRRFGKSNTQTIELTDNGVLTYADESKTETSWTLITHFKLVDDFIFLIPDESFTSAIVVDKRLIATSDLDPLLTFLRATKKEMTKVS